MADDYNCSSDTPESTDDTKETIEDTDTNDNVNMSESEDLRNDGSDDLPESTDDTKETIKNTDTNDNVNMSESEDIRNDGSDNLPESTDDTKETIKNTDTNDNVNMSKNEDLSNDIHRAGHIKSSLLASYMGTALLADKLGYNTVPGFVNGVVGGFTVGSVGKICHVSPDAQAGFNDSMKSMSHLYDTIYAANHPDEVINFSPSPISQEMIDEHTLILQDNPYSSQTSQEYLNIEKPNKK